MADATRAAFLAGNAAPICRQRSEAEADRAFGSADFRHDRIVLYLPTGPQPDTGGGATLVVPKSVPSVAGTAPMRGMHEFVMP